jgi:hypothetical protein
MEISHVNTRPDYFSISGILSTIALMCLSVIFLAHKAKLSGIALSSTTFPSISAANAPLMIHNEARGEAGTALSSSPILQPGDIDNSRKLESSPSLSKTLSQSPSPEKISSAVEKAVPPGLSRTKTNRKDGRSSAKARVGTSRSFGANLRRIFGSFQLRSSAIWRRTF